MLIAYFDESGLSERDDFFAVAAVVGSSDDWSAVSRRWNAALAKHGAPYLHMREFAHRIGAFKGWTEDQRRALMKACLDSVSAAPIAPIATAMDSESERWLDKQGNPFKLGPFFRCFAEVLGGIKTIVPHRSDGGILRSVYSQQDQFKFMLKHVHETARSDAPVNTKIETLEFADMRSVPGLQIADLLAYELRHHYHMKRKNPDFVPRIPLRYLAAHYMYFYRSRIIMFKYLPNWYMKAERAGTLTAKLDEMYGDIAKWAPQISELLAFPPDIEWVKGYEERRTSGARTPHVVFFPAGSLRRNPPQAAFSPESTKPIREEGN